MNSLPAPLLNSPPTSQTILHRLVYRSLLPYLRPSQDAITSSHPSKIPLVEREAVTFEIILSRSRQGLKVIPVEESH